jgi:hypothetical protein
LSLLYQLTAAQGTRQQYSQQDFFQLGQKLLESSKIINTPTTKIDRLQILPIGFEWLNIRDELYELVVGYTKRALREESCIALTHRLVGAASGRAATKWNDWSGIIFIIVLEFVALAVIMDRFEGM